MVSKAYLIQTEDPAFSPRPYLMVASEFPVSRIGTMHRRQKKLLEATADSYHDAKRKLEQYIEARHPELSPSVAPYR